MAKKKKLFGDEEHVDVDKIAEEMDQDLAVLALEDEAMPKLKKKADESDVKKPVLSGTAKAKPKYNQPGTNNQTKIIHEE